MKKILIVSIVLMVLLASSFAALLYVSNRRFEKQRYIDLLHKLRNQGFWLGSPSEFFMEHPTGKVAILMHDVDFRFAGSEILVDVEQDFGVHSCFFLRPDSEWFSASIKFYQTLESEGWEIGFQYDCLSRADGNFTLALSMFKAQLAYMRVFFNITATTYHGDSYNLSISNFDLYNETFWNANGLREIYAFKNYSYICDTNFCWQEPEVLGDFMLVQLHADWW